MSSNSILIEKIKFAFQKAENVNSTITKWERHSDLDSWEFAWFRSFTMSLLESSWHKTYLKEFDQATEKPRVDSFQKGFHILNSFNEEVENWRLDSIKWIISAEIFTNYLEMAEHLLENKYKDAAAVIIGSTLEEHIRQLCIKYEIDIQEEKKWKMVNISVDTMNNSLCNKAIYNKLVQKSIIAWYDLRTKAAHGRREEYTVEQVKLMYDWVLNFITQYSL